MSHSLDQYENRARLYCGGGLPDQFSIVLTASADVSASYSGQVAILVAASLLGRTFSEIGLDLPQAELHPTVPHVHRRLDVAASHEVERSCPSDLRKQAISSNTTRQTLVVRCGEGACDLMFMGSGWVGSVGQAMQLDDENPFGPAMSAVLAASEAFYMARTNSVSPRIRVVDTWRWSDSPTSLGSKWIPQVPVGQVWTVGVGSVGSAALYFLSLATTNFVAKLVDHDKVKIENLSRSPIFGDGHDGHTKVDVVAAYLARLGIDARPEPKLLREFELWMNRQQGVPDLVISTANEDHVRWQIESQFPPVQVHASTGNSFQASVFRHVPVVEPCSLCIFPDSGVTVPMRCATSAVAVPGRDEKFDAAVPFLSFGAGLMAAAEVWKVATASNRSDLGHNRGCLQFHDGDSALSLPITRRTDCSCTTRSRQIHLRAIDGSRFAALSREV